MKHYLNVCDIKGNEVTPVDIITFGSPCQDLSVAGKRAGLKHEANGDEETTRSGLFMEAVRIIKEMRKATNGRYPTFALWENVPGAFSSNRGQDFRTVLEELAKVVDETVSIPMPPKGKWTTAGGLEGDGWSISWRTLDAQYHGVPQRRRRILLVADFRGQRAGEISFKCEGLPGYPSKSREERKETSTDLKRSSGMGYRAEGFDGYNLNMTGNVAKTITSARTDTHSIPGVVQTVYSIQGGGETSQSSRGDGWNENVCYTLNTLDKHAVAYEDSNKTICLGSGKNVVGTLNASQSTKQFLGNQEAFSGDYAVIECEEDPLTANDYKQPISVVYDARGNGNGQIVPTMTGNHDCRITDYTSCVVQTDKNYYDAELEVEVRKYPVNTDKLKVLLRDKKGSFTNRSIAEKLNKPVTLVEHWFRQDDSFAIPDADIWNDLKILLAIDTDEFDESVTTFEQKESAYDMRNRIYVGEKAPTLTCNCGNNLHLLPDHADEQIPFTKSSFSNYSEGVGTLKSSGGDLGGGSETLIVATRKK